MLTVRQLRDWLRDMTVESKHTKTTVQTGCLGDQQEHWLAGEGILDTESNDWTNKTTVQYEYVASDRRSRHMNS